MSQLSLSRNWGRVTHPLRTLRAAVAMARAFVTAHENQPRYLFDRSLASAERARASTADNIVSCPDLELALDGLDPAAASRHLDRLGCLLVRGNAESRAAVLAYRAVLDEAGFTKLTPPCGGALWDFQKPGAVRFYMHELVQRQFYDLCRIYYGADLMMSAAGVSATLRTVKAVNTGGLVPFHQDISPVSMSRTLTFWIAISPDGIGRSAPGLRFIASRRDRRRKKMAHRTSTDGNHETMPGLADHEFFWTPEINVGDVMIFDPYVCHASYMNTDMTEPRTSVDLRVSPFEEKQAESYLAAGHGLVVFNRAQMSAPVVPGGSE